MKHLTHTGPAAGSLLCGKPRENGGEYLHASYAPLHRPEVRASVCPACIATWLAFAFDGEPLPDWPTTPEEIAAIEAAIPAEFASDAEVAAFRVKLRQRTDCQ
jgi:hypothetical protein